MVIIFYFLSILIMAQLVSVIYCIVKNLPQITKEIKGMSPDERDQMKKDAKNSLWNGIKIVSRHIGMFR